MVFKTGMATLPALILSLYLRDSRGWGDINLILWALRLALALTDHDHSVGNAEPQPSWTVAQDTAQLGPLAVTRKSRRRGLPVKEGRKD